MLTQRKSLQPWLFDSVEYYNHQLDGIRQMARMRNCLLADDMGLGKSLQALTVACIDITREWASKVIIIAPATLKGNWADEIEKFTTLPYLVLGQEEDKKKPGHFKKLGPKERDKQLLEFSIWEGPKILVVNYEQLIPHLQAINALRFDICIYDEAHYMKNYKAKRTKAALALEGNRHLLLTGTPMLNHIDELWPLLHKIDPERYRKRWSFVQRYAVWGGYENRQIIGVKNEKELTERLKSVMIRRLKKDVLDLPEVQIIQRRVDLHPEQQRLYDDAIEKMEIEMVGLDDPSEIENALTKFLRLKQICGTTLAFTGQDVSSKLDLAVEDAIEQLDNGRKLVVFTQFRDVLEAFCDRLDRTRPDFDVWELHGDVPNQDRQPIVSMWAAHDKPAVLAGMLQVSGIGLNMTAARHVFFLDKLFVPGLNQQAIDRLHRIGADVTQPVQVFEYICRNTIENRVEAILRTKKKLFNNIVEDSDFKRKLIRALMEDE